MGAPRVLFLASGRSVPSTRFRVLAYLPHLRERGVRCDLALSWPEKYEYFRAIGWRLSQRLMRAVRYLHLLKAKLFRYDAIFLERELFNNPSFELDLRFRKVTTRFILDIDDAIFLRFPDKVQQLARISDRVICGNREIADYIRPFNAAIDIIPTSVELARFQPRSYPDSPPQIPTIGWIGTTQNVDFLKVCAAALRELALKRKFKLLVVATTAERLPGVDLTGVDVEFVPWSPETEVAQLHRMDIGIMPLPEGEDWMRYKCPTKMIQYMATGIAAVATPIGMLDEITADGSCGLAATDTAQWLAHLERLVDDAGLRRSMGEAGRKLVCEKYSVEGNIERMRAILLGIS